MAFVQVLECLAVQNWWPIVVNRVRGTKNGPATDRHEKLFQNKLIKGQGSKTLTNTGSRFWHSHPLRGSGPSPAEQGCTAKYAQEELQDHKKKKKRAQNTHPTSKFPWPQADWAFTGSYAFCTRPQGSLANVLERDTTEQSQKFCRPAPAGQSSGCTHTAKYGLWGNWSAFIHTPLYFSPNRFHLVPNQSALFNYGSLERAVGKWNNIIFWIWRGL